MEPLASPASLQTLESTHRLRLSRPKSKANYDFVVSIIGQDKAIVEEEPEVALSAVRVKHLIAYFNFLDAFDDKPIHLI